MNPPSPTYENEVVAFGTGETELGKATLVPDGQTFIDDIDFNELTSIGVYTELQNAKVDVGTSLPAVVEEAGSNVTITFTSAYTGEGISFGVWENEVSGPPIYEIAIGGTN